MYGSDSTYAYCNAKLENADKIWIAGKIGDFIINTVPHISQDLPSYPKGWASAFAVFQAMGEGYTDMESGPFPNFAGVADDRNANYEAMMDGDNKYRVLTESGRNEVVQRLNAYIKSMTDSLQRIKDSMPENQEWINYLKIKVATSEAAGMIESEGKYKAYLREAESSLVYKKSYLDEFTKKFEPLIKDANTIININQQ